MIKECFLCKKNVKEVGTFDQGTIYMIAKAV
jgi:hypothetical protein